MTIYVLNFNDTGSYYAYTSFERAKQILWECYCDEVDQEKREKYLDEDLKTLEEGYITDYGYINETILVEE
jgi:inorganic pyrophosphatase